VEKVGTPAVYAVSMLIMDPLPNFFSNSCLKASKSLSDFAGAFAFAFFFDDDLALSPCGWTW